MSTRLALDPADNDPLYNTKIAARFLNCSVPTLERWRLAGTGPVYIKCPGLRGKVLYRHSDLVAWLRKHTFNSTSEY